MGADMLLYCCEDPTSYTKAMPLICHRIKNLDDDLLASIAEEHLWYDSDELKENIEADLKEEDLYKLDDLYFLKIRCMVREKLKEAVEELIGEGVGWRRDITHMTLNDVRYIFSGGMSWGDQPSEACDLISLIDVSGIFNGMGSLNFSYESPKK
jgi:hypothetical protein